MVVHEEGAAVGAILAGGEDGSATSRAPAVCHKASNVPSFVEMSHLDPFCRMVPAGPRRSRRAALASSHDASLSTLTSWPSARGIGPAAPRADVALAADAGNDPRHAGATHDAARGDTPSRTAARDSSCGRGEVECGNVRTERARKRPAARSSMPPISGHGARTVMKVRSSEPIGAPEGLELQPRGLRLFGGPPRLHLPC
jgi:hypothetical protein